MQLVVLKGGLGRDCGAASLISVEGGVRVETAVQLVSLVLKGGLGRDCGAAGLISVEGGSGSRLRCS